ncbi:MAG: outer membrane lipoprotein carrier protein LolA [Polaromonas sp.]|nr:outer membrane lipoprotein carrier protein LolA [Polaromonas sp.]
MIARFALFPILFALLTVSPAQAADIDMPGLMRLFANNKNIRAEFVEQKFVRILDAPVESKGELLFSAPARLEKRTSMPRPEALLIDGNQVLIERGASRRSLSLEEFPDMASLVHSLTATFRGDQVSIEQYFNWKLSGPAHRWQLVLRPKSGKLFITLGEIRLAGDGGYVHTVETTLTDGDRSVMTLTRPLPLAKP